MPAVAKKKKVFGKSADWAGLRVFMKLTPFVLIVSATQSIQGDTSLSEVKQGG